MFDIGFLELVLIGVLALVVLGPERLPGAARTAGRIAGKARSLARGLQAQLQQEMAAQEAKLKDQFGGDEGVARESEESGSGREDAQRE